MMRTLFLLILSTLFPFLSVAQDITLQEPVEEDLAETLLKLAEVSDLSEPQRQFALETIKKFEEEAASPDFSPLKFEKSASELIDSLVEQYQFISAGVLLRFAYQILLPYYNSGDVEKYNLQYLANSMADFYLAAQVYYKALSWLDITTHFCKNTGRDFGDHWIRNLFNSVYLFVKSTQIKLAKSVFEEAFEALIALPKDEVSPYTINSMLRAAKALLEYVEADYFLQLFQYLDSNEDLTPINKAHSILFKSKVLTYHFNNYKDAYTMYKELLDSPLAVVAFEEALGDIMETAWHVDKEEYRALNYMASHVGRDLIQLTLNSFALNDTEFFWYSAADQLNRGFGINLNDKDCSQFDFQGIFLNAVFTKALSMISQRELIDIIKEKGSETTKEMLTEMIDFRHKMANTTDKELREHYDGEIEHRESLLCSSIDLSWLAGKQNNDAMLMPRLLNDGECEVEIVEYPSINEKGTLLPNYGAIICTSRSYTDKQLEDTYRIEYYEFVPLGPVLAWELVYNGLGDNRTGREYANQYLKDQILSVTNLFSPLLKYFREHKMTKAYISPTGVLNVINIGAIPWGEDDSIVNDHVEIVRINAAYDVKNIINRDAKLNSAMVFSNIDFNNANSLEDVKESLPNEASTEIAGYRVKVEKGTAMKKFPRLPIDEKKLTESINAGKTSMKSYSGENATEEVFKTINGNAPELLHIDTHGFYIPEGDQAYIGKHVIRGTRESALLTCGLALAGANEAWSGEETDPGKEDGILTAWEISCMDLSGCKLAVLSACETAQGMLDNVNGVIGLQRALKLAGVQAMLLTLWPVDNELTAEFINDFYSRLPSSSNFNEAFLATQKEFRKRHADPYHWAPFILIN